MLAADSELSSPKSAPDTNLRKAFPSASLSANIIGMAVSALELYVIPKSLMPLSKSPVGMKLKFSAACAVKAVQRIVSAIAFNPFFFIVISIPPPAAAFFLCSTL